MNKKFTLAGLMRVRELQEERAAAELARANHERHLAQERRAAAQHVLASQAFPDVAESHLEPGIFTLEDDAPTWRAVVAARASATAMVRESAQVLSAAQQGVDQATDAWAHAKMRAAMIDKLKAKHVAAVEAEDLREEQVLLDEAALRRSLEVTP